VDDDELRMAVVWSLSQIGGEDVRETLENMLEECEDDEEAGVIEEAIDNLLSNRRHGQSEHVRFLALKTKTIWITSSIWSRKTTRMTIRILNARLLSTHRRGGHLCTHFYLPLLSGNTIYSPHLGLPQPQCVDLQISAPVIDFGRSVDFAVNLQTSDPTRKASFISGFRPEYASDPIYNRQRRAGKYSSGSEQAANSSICAGRLLGQCHACLSGNVYQRHAKL
jgi:hypothetical protein